MILIYSLIFATVLSLVFTTSIKKYYWIFYSLATLLATSTFIFEVLKLTSNIKLDGIISEIEKASIKGNLAFAFFMMVMFIGALNTKWKITRKLYSIRGELAIIASIFMLPHVFVYIIKFIMNINKSGSITSLSISYLSYVIVGIMAFTIMVPLFITSLKKVRSKMSAIKWKKIQRCAYGFYLLSYVHIIIILVNKKNIDWLKLSTYTALFAMYIILKLMKVINSKKSKANYNNSKSKIETA